MSLLDALSSDLPTEASTIAAARAPPQLPIWPGALVSYPAADDDAFYPA